MKLVIRSLIGTAVSAAVLYATFGVGVANADPANRDTAPTREDLMKDCDKSHRCNFIPAKERNYNAPPEQASPAVFNCLQSRSTYTLDVSDTMGTSSTTEVSSTLSASFLEIFTASVTARYNHTWSESHTFRNSYQVPIDPGWVAWVDYGAPMTKVTGQVNLWYSQQYAGHWNWFMDDVKIAGPNPDGQPNVLLQARVMTAAEKRQFCRTAPATTSGVTAPRTVTATKPMSGATRTTPLAP